MGQFNIAALRNRSRRREFALGAALHRVRTRARRVPALLVGVAVLGAIKALDGATTILGLTRIPGAVEQNPLVAASIGVFGLVPGLCVVAVGSVVLTAVATEFGGYLVAGPSRSGPMRRLIRVAGFGSAALSSLLPVVSNVLVLLDHGVLG